RQVEELTETDRGKDEFLHHLAHEVRNALGPIRTALHLLGEGDRNGDDAHARDLAEHGVRHLSRLKDDLIRVSSPIATPRATERVSLADVVGQPVSGLLASQRLGGRNLTVQMPAEPLWLDADPARLQQVLEHLLDNAVKYTAAGGSIRLSAACEPGAVAL